MCSKLVFLHIPKSGGTSQRARFYEQYGKERVYWHGIDAPNGPGRVYDQQEYQGFPVVGGHQPISFYPPGLDAIYLSIVRDPVSRAVSAFSYYMKPEFSIEPGAQVARERAMAKMISHGMDPESLVKSLKNSQYFLSEIRNHQCHYLSRYESSFEGVMRTLEENRMIIGDQARTEVFNNFLADRFGWEAFSVYFQNRSKPETHQMILEEPGALELLQELLVEDQKLYDHVQQSEGVVASLPEDFSVPEELAPRKTVSDHSIVQVYSKGFMGFRPDGTGRTSIVINNHFTVPLGQKNFPGIAIYCRPIDAEGRPIGKDLFPQPLHGPIRPGAWAVRQVQVEFPRAVLEKTVTVSIGVKASVGPSAVPTNPMFAAIVGIIHV